jgi:hypothetical protein
VRTTAGPQTITIYATDDLGNSHYVTENVTVNLASSSGAVFTTDSTSVTIPAGSYYTQAARLLPVGVGSAQLSATDPRAAIYKYNTGTQNISVIHPNLSLSWGSVALGLGQYIDVAYDGSYYVSSSDYQAAPLTVTLTHVGGAIETTTPASVTIPTSSYYQYIRINAIGIGTDTIAAAASSPFHNGDSAYVSVDSGTVVLSGWPANIAAVGDSVAVTLQVRDPHASAVRRVIAATTFTLTPNANIEFRQGGAAVTQVTVPADGTQVQFHVKAIASGTGSATIAHANYKRYTTANVTIP